MTVTAIVEIADCFGERFQGRRQRQAIMDRVMDETTENILKEITGLLSDLYGSSLKAVILYGSVARGTQTEDSDVDILVLVDGTLQELRAYGEGLSDVSTDLALKYFKVFSIMDVSYQEYMDWKTVSPFYRNVEKEGIVLYAA